MSGKNRSKELLGASNPFEVGTKSVALMEPPEIGKPVNEASDEIQEAADPRRYPAPPVRIVHGDSHRAPGVNILDMMFKEPIGIMATITFRNLPFWTFSQKLPFVFAVRCNRIVKPSELTPGTTAVTGEFLLDAGFPPSVVNFAPGNGLALGWMMCAHPRVGIVAFSGSTSFGRAIAASASNSLMKTVLGLGVRNAGLVIPDTDNDGAADTVTFGLDFSAGQSCNSGRRDLFREDITDERVGKVDVLSQGLAFAKPHDPATRVRVIASSECRRGIDGHMRRLGACDNGTIARIDGFAELAFGAMNQSGLGREKGSCGLHEFLEVKTLVVRTSRTREPWVKTP